MKKERVNKCDVCERLDDCINEGYVLRSTDEHEADDREHYIPNIGANCFKDMTVTFEKKISKKEAINLFDGDDLLTEIHKMISGKVSENYDELIFSLLGQFGITKDNWRENLGRVTIYSCDRDVWTKHFYIDGGYRFSIVEQPGELIFDDEKCEYGVAVSYKVEVFKDMLEV